MFPVPAFTGVEVGKIGVPVNPPPPEPPGCPEPSGVPVPPPLPPPADEIVEKLEAAPGSLGVVAGLQTGLLAVPPVPPAPTTIG